MKKLLSILLTIGLLIGLTACGASYDTYAAQSPAMPKTEAAAEAAAVNADYGLAGGGEGSAAAVPESRKWIIRIYLTAETENLDAMTAQLQTQIQEAGGYVENQSIYNGSSRNTHRYRSASMTIRIPADQADTFAANVGGISNVISQEKTMEDITLTYVATESRMNALKTEEIRLLELLAQAVTMEDLLAIEARLTEVRSELEAVTSQMRIFDNQVDYATIHLTIDEVQQYTPVEEPTFWERITKGFSNSLEGVAEDAVDFVVWIIASSPYLVIYGGIALLLFKLRKKLPKRKKKAKTMPEIPVIQELPEDEL